jgi:hypothetical protein
VGFLLPSLRLKEIGLRRDMRGCRIVQPNSCLVDFEQIFDQGNEIHPLWRDEIDIQLSSIPKWLDTITHASSTIDIQHREYPSEGCVVELSSHTLAWLEPRPASSSVNRQSHP